MCDLSKQKGSFFLKSNKLFLLSYQQIFSGYANILFIYHCKRAFCLIMPKRPYYTSCFTIHMKGHESSIYWLTLNHSYNRTCPVIRKMKHHVQQDLFGMTICWLILHASSSFGKSEKCSLYSIYCLTRNTLNFKEFMPDSKDYTFTSFDFLKDKEMITKVYIDNLQTEQMLKKLYKDEHQSYILSLTTLAISCII